ncbi:MAG: hypothetical protein KME12_15100 [Trichocoleus desertorum ATA4-8-CV12]|nr:hypothetical protein [Trichocoleus desertorum ATA4-8-CV12]
MSQFEKLEDSEVISVNSSDQIVIAHTTFKVYEFIKVLKESFFGRIAEEITKKWLIEGMSCEVLSPGKGWRKGKVKLGLVFCPDESDSPLDDIRQQISEEGDRD